jgi:hypothetical protein
MEKTLIETGHDWILSQTARKFSDCKETCYIREELVFEFSRWSRRRANLIGFTQGMAFSLFVAIIAKLV